MSTDEPSGDRLSSDSDYRRDLRGDEARSWFFRRYQGGPKAHDALLTAILDVFGSQELEQLEYRAIYDLDIGQPRQLVIGLPYAIDSDAAWSSIDRVLEIVGTYGFTNTELMDQRDRNLFVRAVSRIALIPSLPPENIEGVLSRAQRLASSQ